MSVDTKLYVEVCINFKHRQVRVNTFSSGGKKIYEKLFNNIEFVELSGVSRILVSEHMVNDIICLNLESDSIQIIQQGLVLKIK